MILRHDAMAEYMVRDMLITKIAEREWHILNEMMDEDEPLRKLLNYVIKHDLSPRKIGKKADKFVVVLLRLATEAVVAMAKEGPPAPAKVVLLHKYSTDRSTQQVFDYWTPERIKAEVDRAAHVPKKKEGKRELDEEEEAGPMDVDEKEEEKADPMDVDGDQEAEEAEEAKEAEEGKEAKEDERDEGEVVPTRTLPWYVAEHKEEYKNLKNCPEV